MVRTAKSFRQAPGIRGLATLFWTLRESCLTSVFPPPLWSDLGDVWCQWQSQGAVANPNAKFADTDSLNDDTGVEVVYAYEQSGVFAKELYPVFGT